MKIENDKKLHEVNTTMKGVKRNLNICNRFALVVIRK